MEFDWLEDFLALAELKHFGRAAERRNVSQPAFSRRVRLLEEWVGAPLFNRDTHRVALTAAGRQWLTAAEDILRRTALARDQAREAARSAAATLRFASTHALSVTFFPRWLEAIEAENPVGSAVQLTTDNMAGCERLMLQGQAHFLLCHHHPATPVSLKASHFMQLDIGSDVLVPVCAPALDGLLKPRFALPGSPDAPLAHLSFSEVSGMGRILASSQILERPGAWLTPAFTAHVASVLSAMAQAGRGLAWLPLSLVEHDLEAGALVRAGDAAWDVPVTVRIHRPRARQSEAVERFWTRLKARTEDAGPGA